MCFKCGIFKGVYLLYRILLYPGIPWGFACGFLRVLSGYPGGAGRLQIARVFLRSPFAGWENRRGAAQVFFLIPGGKPR